MENTTEVLSASVSTAAEPVALKAAIGSLASLYLVEATLGGPGSWSPAYLGFDLRRTMFIIVCTLLVSSIFSGRAQVRLLDTAVLLIGTIGFIFWMMVLPWIEGGDQIYALIDGIPAVSIFVVCWLFAVQARHWGSAAFSTYALVSRVAYVAATFAAIAHVLLWIFLVNLPEQSYPYLAVLNHFLDAKESGSLYVGPMPDGSTRVFWISSLFIVYGLYCAVRDISRRNAIRSSILIALFVFAIYVTQTRSLLLGLPLAVLLAWPVRRLISRASLSTSGLLITALLVGITFFVTAAAEGKIADTLGIGRGDSDDSRNFQIDPLVQTWWESPIVGHGFGSHAVWIRSDEAPFSYELSILALYMKVGILGALLSCAYFLYLIYTLIPSQNVAAANSRQFAALFGCVFIFVFAFNTNPYMSNSIGVAIIFLCCVEVAYLAQRPLAARAARSTV